MSEPASPPEARPGPDREGELTALFANLVLQHTEMALMLLGKAPNPQSGKTLFDLDHARLVIDQLEMLEAKTRGNLSKEEDGLLKQSLMTLRLAFVAAVDAAPAQEKPGADATTQAPKPDASSPTAAAPSSMPEEESKKKFTKKY
jgi:hypothetical protein